MTVDALQPHQHLGTVGERRIIDEILRPRYGRSIGDDCASLPLPRKGESLLLTTDPCPSPAATLLGFEDPYYFGWLVATINLSDLAASGARPVGLLTSLVLPNETSVDSFRRILDGIDDCVLSVGAQVFGGNLKEGQRVDGGATAVGFCAGPPMTRVGAVDGDEVFVLGDFGLFWAGFLAFRNGLIASGDPLLRNVLTPQPKSGLGVALQASGIVKGCMDVSDGLYPSLVTLAEANGLGVLARVDQWKLSPEVDSVAGLLGIDGRKLAMGWGDWQLLVAVSPVNRPRLEAIAASAMVEVHHIGTLTVGSGVRAQLGGSVGQLMPLDSQRFTSDSWFTAGIDSYIKTMLQSELVQFESD